MSIPQPDIDADDFLIGDLIAGTLELISEAGGWVSPDARLVAREGQLSMESDGDEFTPLLRIPSEVFVRVDLVTWGESDGRVEIVDIPQGFGALETEMLYLQVALYNQCDKLEWMQRTHPSLVADLPETVVEATRVLVPSFQTEARTAVDMLWANRCFRIPIEGSDYTGRALIPVVDFLNHHSRGAQGQWDGSSFRVDTINPHEDSECSLNYGHSRDALETAVVYGFCDGSVELAHSAPVTLEVPGIGTAYVATNGRASDGSAVPLTVVTSGSSTVISHLDFFADDRSMADEIAVASGWDVHLAEAVEQAAREVNVRLLADLISACEPHKDIAAVEVLLSSAQRQLAVLQRDDS